MLKFAYLETFKKLITNFRRKLIFYYDLDEETLYFSIIHLRDSMIIYIILYVIILMQNINTTYIYWFHIIVDIFYINICDIMLIIYNYLYVILIYIIYPT